MSLLTDTTNWGAAEWGLVVAIVATVLGYLAYRSGVQQGKKAEEARHAENERRERAEAQATVQRAEHIGQRLAQYEGNLTRELADLHRNLRQVETTLATFEAEVTGFRQDLGTVRTAESLQFLLFTRRWRQAAATVCESSKSGTARTREMARLRDELTDRCGPELGIAAYELPARIAGLTGRSLEQFQTAHRGGADTRLAGVAFPIAVALHCLDTAGAHLCELAAEDKHPDLRSSLEHLYFYAVTDYMKTLEQELPAPPPAPAADRGPGRG